MCSPISLLDSGLLPSKKGLLLNSAALDSGNVLSITSFLTCTRQLSPTAKASQEPELPLLSVSRRVSPRIVENVPFRIFSSAYQGSGFLPTNRDPPCCFARRDVVVFSGSIWPRQYARTNWLAHIPEKDDSVAPSATAKDSS